MSSTEENYNKLITKQAGPEKWLGVEESKAVFGNTKLVLDGDNSKIIQEKRFKQMAQLQREVQIGMLLKDLHHEEKMQNRIKYLFKNDFDNYRRRYIQEENSQIKSSERRTAASKEENVIETFKSKRFSQ